MTAPLMSMAIVGWERYRYLTGMFDTASGIGLVAWLAMSLVVSRALWLPDSWRYEDDGRPSTGAMVQAAMVYAWTLLGMSLFGTTFHVMMDLIIPD
jgi:hypothetical protein